MKLSAGGALAILALIAACGRPADDAANAGATVREPTGIPAVLLPVPEDPTVSFSIRFNVGSQNDPAGKEGLAYLTGQMIAQASTEQDSLERILEKLYPIASRYAIRVDLETSTLTGRTHHDNIAAFTELYTNAYRSPAFLETDFERVKRDTINYLSNTLRYSSDEELGKAALYEFIFAGTPYAHPARGHIASLESVTLDDVRDFYRRYFQPGNALVALGGGYDDALVTEMEDGSWNRTGADTRAPPHAPAIEPEPIEGLQVVLVDKPGADASISLGFPIDVHRGERDFYALWIANSWLGEHRNQASHLFQVIREARGLNYGDYSYIEAFPEGGSRTMPPVNVPRRQQLFEIWIRTLPNDQAIFALRAALRELANLVDGGMSRQEFELTRNFLKKYVLQFADTTSSRLGYAVDDEFYGIENPGHLQRFADMMDELTLDDVNAAVRAHLQYDNIKIAIVTGDAEGLRKILIDDAPTPISYSAPKSDQILSEDTEIASFPLDVDAENVIVWPIATMFAGE